MTERMCTHGCESYCRSAFILREGYIDEPSCDSEEYIKLVIATEKNRIKNGECVKPEVLAATIEEIEIKYYLDIDDSNP